MKRLERNRISYVFDWRLEPVLHINPNETIVVETEDSCTGRIRQPEDLTPENQSRLVEEFDWFGPRARGNPVTGPIFVNGAEPGDTLVVKIEQIECDSQGFTGFWPVPSRGMADWFDHPVVVITPIVDGQVIFNDRVRFPVRPMIGTIGTTPPLEVPLSGVSGTYGGNMDCPDVAAGSTLYLPVYVPGGMLFMGDAHAIQGDGEVCGGGIEMRSEIYLTVAVKKGRPASMTWPRVETEEALVTIASGSPLEVALRLALREMILWIEEEYGHNRAETYMLASQVGDARPCQVVVSPYTMRFRMPKAYL